MKVEAGLPHFQRSLKFLINIGLFVSTDLSHLPLKLHVPDSV